MIRIVYHMASGIKYFEGNSCYFCHCMFDKTRGVLPNVGFLGLCGGQSVWILSCFWSEIGCIFYPSFVLKRVWFVHSLFDQNELILYHYNEDENLKPFSNYVYAICRYLSTCRDAPVTRKIPGGGGTPCICLYWEVTPQRGAFVAFSW